MFVINKTNHRTVDVDELVYAARFSPFELSSDLLAIGTSSKIVIVSCQSSEEKASLEDMTFEQVVDINHGLKVTDLAWSVQTNLHSIPRQIRLFTAGGDRKIRHLTSDLKDSTHITVIGEHRDYVNAIASNPELGSSVASVSDDRTCRIWPIPYSDDPTISFALSSPGMAVCWHPLEPSKIMVAEKNGTIRFYSIVTQQAFMSLDCCQAPLLSADWCRFNPLTVAAVAGSDWYVFDTSQSSLPLENRTVHSGGGQLISWSLSHDHLFATTGRPGSLLKVFYLRTNRVILSVERKIVNGLSWHCRQPIVAVGSDSAVHLYLVENV